MLRPLRISSCEMYERKPFMRYFIGAEDVVGKRSRSEVSSERVSTAQTDRAEDVTATQALLPALTAPSPTSRDNETHDQLFLTTVTAYSGCPAIGSSASTSLGQNG
jgi:hypothetical protein